jgi:hypothetical protein
MSIEIYKKWNWNLAMDYNWRIQSVTKAMEELRGVCLGTLVKIRDVIVRKILYTR